MQKWTRSAAILSALCLITANLAFAAPKGTGQEVPANYLVSFKDGHQAAKALANAGFSVEDDWSDLGAAVVRTNHAGHQRLKRLPGVESVDTEQTFHKMGVFSDNLPMTWGLQAIRAQEAWNLGARGQGIRVCVLDTGIDYNHPAFFRNGVSIIKGSKNFVKDGRPDAADGDGHGTHVAGTIAAQGHTVWGAAPDVDLYIGRVLGDDGTGTSSSVINGVKWCGDTVKAHVISMSLGGGRYTKTEDRTFTKYYNKGSLIIAAAGNAGDGTISYPAGYKDVLSVAAVDANLARASFSQYNSDVELAGPGVAVLSSVPRGTGEMAAAAEGATDYASTRIEFAAHGSVSGPLVECGLGDSTASCTNVPATGAWIAVVSRGSISFADKAKNVMAQGAPAMLLTNSDTANPDDTGSFTFGAAGSWLPAVSVSYNSGVAIRSGGLDAGTVSLTPWDYANSNGTSMATPHVSAVAALAWSARPTLSNATVRSILQSTASDLGPAGRDTAFGYGLVQADAAVSKAISK